VDKLKLLSWILRGSQRRVIFEVIESGLIPAQIYEKAKQKNPKITRNNVSDILREFRDKELVICINPKETKGRIYKLTKKAEKLSR
jgi:transcription initiation factor IIE alpha subunit